jgi:hypothetical protein
LGAQLIGPFIVRAHTAFTPSSGSLDVALTTTLPNHSLSFVIAATVPQPFRFVNWQNFYAKQKKCLKDAFGGRLTFEITRLRVSKTNFNTNAPPQAQPISIKRSLAHSHLLIC